MLLESREVVKKAHLIISSMLPGKTSQPEAWLKVDERNVAAIHCKALVDTKTTCDINTHKVASHFISLLTAFL